MTESLRDKSPVELIEIYTERVWHNYEYELIREIFTEPFTRYDVGGVAQLSHDEQIARVKHAQEHVDARFYEYTLHGDVTWVTQVWAMHGQKGDPIEMASIEVWKKGPDGRLEACWNPPQSFGRWGKLDDPTSIVKRERPAIPHAASEIDPKWMRAMIDNSSIKLPRLEIVKSKPIGEGGVGTTVQLDVMYNAAPGDNPSTFICKLCADTPERVNAAAESGINLTEINALKLLNEDQTVHVPALYYSDLDESGAYPVLIMEDLSQAGELGNQVAGCSIVQADAVFEEFSKLHAHYWQSDDLKTVDWLRDRVRATPVVDAMYQAGLPALRERLGERVSEENYALVEQFAPYAAKWYSAGFKRQTLTHTDARADNIIFVPDAEGHPNAYLIDWATATFADPSLDTAYFLNGSVSVEDRRNIETRLIETHTQRLQDVDATYTLDEAWENYRLNMVSGLLGTVVGAMYIPRTPAKDDLLAALTERNCAAVLDWESMKAIKARFD